VEASATQTELESVFLAPNFFRPDPATICMYPIFDKVKKEKIPNLHFFVE